MDREDSVKDFLDIIIIIFSHLSNTCKYAQFFF